MPENLSFNRRKCEALAHAIHTHAEGNADFGFSYGLKVDWTSALVTEQAGAVFVSMPSVDSRNELCQFSISMFPNDGEPSIYFLGKEGPKINELHQTVQEKYYAVLTS